MNFTNRDSNTQSQPARSNQPTNTNVAGPLNNALKATRKKGHDWMKGGLAILLISLTIIIIGTVYLLHVANPNAGKYVKSNSLQAIFLENGQVYFGNIKSLSSKYIDLQNIFYLNNPSSGSTGSSSSTSATNLSLVKLGCELHGPYDEMVINNDQVTFWENLRPDGQVAKAVAQYEKDNPKGQTCTQSSSSTNQSTSSTQSTATPAASTDTTTTPKQ